MGIEEHGEPAEVEEFRSTVFARQTEAEEAFVTDGDPGPRMDLWSKKDPVTLFGAIGMSQSGWDKLSETFTWVVAVLRRQRLPLRRRGRRGGWRHGLHPGLRALQRIDRRAPR